MNVLVTGGAGYIGSHTVVELINAGHTPIIADNLYNAKADVLDRIRMITGKRPVFYKVDCVDKTAMETIFTENQIDAVIHFAAYKAVGESVRKPLEYYRNNLDSAMTLLEVMEKFRCKGAFHLPSRTLISEYPEVKIHPLVCLVKTENGQQLWREREDPSVQKPASMR